MLVRRLLIVLGTIVSLVGAAACGRGMESEAGALELAPATATSSSAAQDSNDGVGAVVDVTPVPDTELAGEPTGQSEPGAGADGGTQPEPETPPGSSPPGPMLVYADSAYQFSVGYPADFTFRAQPTEKLAQLEPLPDASYIWMNPTAASSDVAELEPADLEIRVYASEDATALESWLTSKGLLPADGSGPFEPFQTAHVSGVKLCVATMIVPNCSYYVLGSGWVYQLIPVTLDGESMLQTFMLSSEG